MPWVTKTGYRILPNGMRVPYTYQTWVPDTYTGGGAAAEAAEIKREKEARRKAAAAAAAAAAKAAAVAGAAGAAAAAKVAAKKAAEAAAKAKAKAAAEKQAAAEAKARKAAAQAQLWAHLKAVANTYRKGVDTGAAAEGAELIALQRAKKGQMQFGPTPEYLKRHYALLAERKANQMEQEMKRRQAWAEQYAASKKRSDDLAYAKAHPNTKKSGMKLEGLLADALKRQKASAGSSVETKYIEEIRKMYDDYGRNVSQTYDIMVAVLKKNYVVNKKGQLVRPKSEQARLNAMKFYNGKDFQRVQNEVNRLFGTDKDHQGTFVTAMTQMDQIHESQEDWIYAQGKAAFRKKLSVMRRKDPEAAAAMSKEWEQYGKYAYASAAKEIGPADTTMVYETKNGKLVGRKRTVEEEFEHRQVQFEAEMKRRYDQAVQQQQRHAQYARMEARLDAGSTGQMQRDAQALAAAQLRTGMSNTEKVTNPDQIKGVVQEALKGWDVEAKKYILKPETVALLNGKNGPRGAAYAKNRPDYIAYMDARKRKESSFYNHYGMETPSFIDEAMKVPGVTGAMTILGAPLGALGTWLRTGAKAVTSVLDPSNQSSTIDLGINMAHLPKEQREAYKAWALTQGPGTMVGGMLGGLSVLGSGQAIEGLGSPLDAWLKTPEGKAWRQRDQLDRRRQSQEQDWEAAQKLGQSIGSKPGEFGGFGGWNPWAQLEGMSAFGATPFNADAANLAWQLAADPLNAFPLNPLKYAARLNYARNATKGVEGLLGLNRAAKGTYRWLTVSENTLRFRKSIDPYLRMLEEVPESQRAARAATVTELIEQKLIDLPAKARRDEAAKMLESMGVNPRSANGHQLMSLVEESVLERMEKMGVDYRDVAKRAGELESDRIAAAAAKKAEDSAEIRRLDAAEVAREAAAKAETEAGAARVGTKAMAEAELAERISKMPSTTDWVPPSRRASIETSGAVDVVEMEVRATATTTPMSAPLNRVAEDSLRRAASEANVTDAKTVSFRRTQKQRTASLLHLVDSSHDVVTIRGYSFAPGKTTDKFLQSQEFRDIAAVLDEPIPEGRTHTPEEARARADLRRTKELAEERLYEVGRRSQAEAEYAAETVGLKGIDDGIIPWEVEPASGAHFVDGGARPHEQHIATASELAARGSLRSPAEELAGAALRKDIENLQKEMVSLYARMREGHLTPEQFEEAMQIPRSAVVVRDTTNLTADIRSGGGVLRKSDELDHILAGDVDGIIRVGDQMYEDLMATGHLGHYYQSLSLYPNMMVGPGYETALMSAIKTPEFRANLTRRQFAAILSRKMFRETEVGPVAFRQGTAHLFALFHLTLLDGDMVKLYELSKSVRVLLDGEPDNLFGHAWRVMETRAGVPWAGRFIDVEDDFIYSANLGGQTGATVHPNLALAMIPAGPLARVLPVTHGYVGHMAGLASAVNPMFKSSPSFWTDLVVLDRFSFLANSKAGAEELVSEASRIAHYIASRYGNSVRRKPFTVALQDAAIEASGMYRTKGLRNEQAIVALRNHFVDEQMLQRGIGESGRAVLVDEFEKLFTDALPGKTKRREFVVLREAYDEMYWAGRISHQNPGLHTAAFFEKMMNPKLQRGDTWVKYADTYMQHMSNAGATAEGEAVIRAMFETEIWRVSQDLAEYIRQVPTTGKGPGKAIGHVYRFFERWGIIGRDEIERLTTEADQRIPLDEKNANEAAVDEAKASEFLNQDEEALALRQDDGSSMYDMATVENQAMEMSRAARSHIEATNERTALGKRSRRPDKDDMKFWHKQFAQVAREQGPDAARDWLAAMKKSNFRAHQWLVVEIRQRSAQARIYKMLNSVVHRTMDMEAIPVAVADEMEAMVKILKGMEGGQRLINQFAEQYSEDLFRSRLIDYFKHEEWFKFNEVKAADPLLEAKSLATKAVVEARDAITNARTNGKPVTPSLRGKLGAAQRRLNEASKAAEEAIEGRVPGELPPARPGEEGFVVGEPPRKPSANELNHRRIAMSQRALEIMQAMSEEQWLQREMLKAQRARRASKDPGFRRAASDRIRDIHRAFKVIEVSKAGPKGSYATPKGRKAYTAGVLHAAGDRAKAVIAPKMVAPYVRNAAAAEVEQGRSLNRLLRNSPVDEKLTDARAPGEVSATYKAKGKDIEATFDVPVDHGLLERHGFDADALVDLDGYEITAADLILNLDEFRRTLRNPRFAEFTVKYKRALEKTLQEVSGDKTYTIERWMDDRLVHRADHMDARLFERVDYRVSDEIARARQGRRSTRRLDARGKPRPRSDNPMTVLFEKDVRAVVAKTKVLNEMGIDPQAYNEARKVLRNPMLRKRTAQDLVARATKRARDELVERGLSTGTKAYDEAFMDAYDAAFLDLRKGMAEQEAMGLLDDLASDEMLGAPIRDVIAEFERRYGLDGETKGYEPGPITPFQKRTLEEAIKTHLHVADPYDAAEMSLALRNHGTQPPWHKGQKAMREYLTKYGFWSPRTGEAIAAGKKSWSIQDEAAYYRDNWHDVPEWADDALLKESGRLENILHNEAEYSAKHREWGTYNSSMFTQFSLSKMTREERVRLLVEGSESLGIKAKRDLALERQYVKDRYGLLVADPAGNLIAMPWLMNRKELRAYIINRTAKNMADDLVQTADELDTVERLIDHYVGNYMDEFALSGKAATYEDVYLMSANVVHDILADPVWLKRPRDHIGRMLRGQAALRRSVVFTQIAFAVTNVVDSQIKGAWSAFTNRSYRRGVQSEAAKALDLRRIGIDPGKTQLLYDEPVRAVGRMREAIGREPRLYHKADGTVVQEGAFHKVLADGFDVMRGATEVPADVAGKAENFTKLRLAQSMYDGVYADALKTLGDPDLADAAAREFIGKEVNRFWPVSGDGSIERVFNNLSPFLSYQFKNHVLFISELIAHPVMFNYFNHIGDFIEKANRERWERDGTFPEDGDAKARMIELPWAPGYFFDFGSLSDIQRGLKPLYDLTKGKESLKGYVSQFVRLVSANDINVAYGILNALDIPSHYEWVKIRDEDGYPTGDFRRVEVGWEAPWGGQANALNSFWPYELGSQAMAAMEGAFTAEEATAIAARTFFFGGLYHMDKGKGLEDFYFALKQADPNAAKAWLDNDPNGADLRLYWAEIAAGEQKTYGFYAPKDVAEILNPTAADPRAWFHSQSDEFQTKVKQGFEDLNSITNKWGAILWELDPSTEAFREAKLRASTERWDYYRTHPWMYEYEAGTMTAQEWAKRLNDWEVNDKMDDYFAIKFPKESDFKTKEAYLKEREKVEKQQAKFLETFPQVAERLARDRTSVEAVWTQTENHWFDVLDEIGRRGIAIEAAKQSKDYPILDQLYLINELDYASLNRDIAVSYYNPFTDFNTLPKGVLGPPTVKGGPGGSMLLPNIQILPDFGKWSFNRMNATQKKEFERNQKYVAGMKEVAAIAKRSGKFDGAVWFREMQKRPDLLEEYFRQNPGKREKWAANDEYFRIISRFGILMKQGKFEQGSEYFDRMPAWVKARYYAKHPDRRAKAAQNLKYMQYMKKWTNFYRNKDYEGGAAFFEKLPSWVKQKYYANNPNGFGKGGGSAYAKAMGKWVKLLQDGKDEQAKAYFDALPQKYKDRYYAKHPEQKLRADIKRTAQLAQYFSADDANRAVYLKQNPEFAKWLVSQKDDKQTRRMLIMAGYQALPADSWLKRVYREQYPEVFSKEAAGERAIAKVTAFLGAHPEMTPAFKKWMEQVLATYAESLKHHAARPKPIESDHSRQRRPRPTMVPHHGQSAAWVRLHSVA